MPTSETRCTDSGSPEEAEDRGPDQRSGDDVAECRSQSDAAESRDEDQRSAKHQRRVAEKPSGYDRIGMIQTMPLPWRQEVRGTAAGSRRAAPCADELRPARSFQASRWRLPARPRASGSARPTPRRLRRASDQGHAVRPARRKPGRKRRHAPACDNRSTRRSSSSCTASGNPAPAGRRAELRASIFSIERVRIAQRSSQPQDLGRVERRTHSRRQVVPPGPSSKTMPSALSSSRIRSAVAKSRFFLASARSAMRWLRSSSSSPPPRNHSRLKTRRAVRASRALAFTAPRLFAEPSAESGRAAC